MAEPRRHEGPKSGYKIDLPSSRQAMWLLHYQVPGVIHSSFGIDPRYAMELWEILGEAIMDYATNAEGKRTALEMVEFVSDGKTVLVLSNRRNWHDLDGLTRRITNAGRLRGIDFAVHQDNSPRMVIREPKNRGLFAFRPLSDQSMPQLRGAPYDAVWMPDGRPESCSVKSWVELMSVLVSVVRDAPLYLGSDLPAGST